MCGICPTLTKANLLRGQHGYADEYHGGGKPMVNADIWFYLTIAAMLVMLWIGLTP